jgi:succinate dehydrogenase/fumarate reductase flavoprotein subunit
MVLENVVETDILVIGGGIAGCFAAIKAKEQGVDVTIVDKAYASKSGGVVSAVYYMVFNPEWGHNLDACMNVINKNGEYLNNHEWTKIILKDSWATYQDLVSWGVESPVGIGKMEDYSTLSRVDSSGLRKLFGQIIMRRGTQPSMLRKQAVKTGVKVMDRIMVTDFLRRDGKVVGAIGFSMDSGDFYIFKAKATVVSTGVSSFKPAGYALSSLTGDGDAMAYRAGAEVTGKEFPVKFITLSAYPEWRSYIGYGPYPNFTDADGKPIDLRNIENVGFWDLAMDFVIHAGKGPIVWNLDSAAPEDIEAIRKLLQQSEGSTLMYDRIGLDLSRGSKSPMKSVPVAGGAGAGSSDSQTGGIWPVSTQCATSLPGLYVAGECCGTRYLGTVHTGRGFGLTASAVTGTRAGRGAAEYALQMEKSVIDKEELARLKKIMWAPAERKGGFSPRWVTQILQNTMTPYFILHIKHEKRLQAALTIVEFLRDHLVPKLIAKDSHELRLAHETKNMVLNAEMILRASLFRTESRGQHYREDYPRRDDPAWLAWVKLKERQGKMETLREPIPKKWWPDLSKPYEERYPRRFLGE